MKLYKFFNVNGAANTPLGVVLSDDNFKTDRISVVAYNADNLEMGSAGSAEAGELGTCRDKISANITNDRIAKMTDPSNNEVVLELRLLPNSMASNGDLTFLIVKNITGHNKIAVIAEGEII